MATFCNIAYTWQANKNNTSESITGGMSGYGFTSAPTTYDNEDLCFSPPASHLKPAHRHRCQRDSGHEFSVRRARTPSRASYLDEPVEVH